MEINGLQYIPDFISPEFEQAIVKDIDSCEWSTELKRRVQHYGYKYDYTRKSIDPSMKVQDLRPWMNSLFPAEIFPEPPDQVILNEYEPGQGIFKHVDCPPCFKNTIASLSLLSACVMQFTSLRTGELVELVLEPRSLLVLAGESRYDWQHGIPARKSDRSIPRSRRISATFRNVILCSL